MERCVLSCWRSQRCQNKSPTSNTILHNIRFRTIRKMQGLMRLFNLSLWRRPSQNWAPSNRETGTRGERVKITSQHDHTHTHGHYTWHNLLLSPTWSHSHSMTITHNASTLRITRQCENQYVWLQHVWKNMIILMWHNHMIQQTETDIRAHTHARPSN